MNHNVLQQRILHAFETLGVPLTNDALREVEADLTSKIDIELRRLALSRKPKDCISYSPVFAAGNDATVHGHCRPSAPACWNAFGDHPDFIGILKTTRRDREIIKLEFFDRPAIEADPSCLGSI